MPRIDREFEEATGVRRVLEAHSQAAAAREQQESRFRFLLESFERVFVEARKVAEQMKQLDSVLKSPAVSIEVEAGGRPPAEQVANSKQLGRKDRKPPASDR